MRSVSEILELPILPIKLLLAFLDYETDDKGNIILWQPSVNHHGLNVSTPPYKLLEEEVHRTLRNESIIPTLNSNLHCILFERTKSKLNSCHFSFKSNKASSIDNIGVRKGYKVLDYRVAQKFVTTVSSDEDFKLQVEKCTNMNEIQTLVSAVVTRIYFLICFRTLPSHNQMQLQIKGLQNIKLGLLDGLHRTFAILTYIHQRNKLPSIMSHVWKFKTTIYNMEKQFSKVMNENALYVDKFERLCKQLSLAIGEDGARSVGHTLSDAFFNCFHYVNQNTDRTKIPELKVPMKSTSKSNKVTTTSVNILTLSDGQAKTQFNNLFGKHVKELHRILCQSTEYYNLLSQAKVTKQVPKDKFFEDFDKMAKQVNILDLYLHSFIVRIQKNMNTYFFHVQVENSFWFGYTTKLDNVKTDKFHENSSAITSYNHNTPTFCCLRFIQASFLLENGTESIHKAVCHLTNNDLLTAQRIRYIIMLADYMAVKLIYHHTRMTYKTSKSESLPNITNKKTLTRVLSDLFIGLLCESYSQNELFNDENADDVLSLFETKKDELSAPLSIGVSNMWYLLYPNDENDGQVDINAVSGKTVYFPKFI